MHNVTAAPFVIECDIPSEEDIFGAGDDDELDPDCDELLPKRDEKIPFDFPSSSSGTKEERAAGSGPTPSPIQHRPRQSRHFKIVTSRT